MVGFLVLIGLVIYFFYKLTKANHQKMYPNGFDYVVMIKGKDVSEIMLGKTVQEVYKCRQNGKVFRGKSHLAQEDLHTFLVNTLQLSNEAVEVYHTKPFLSYIRFYSIF